MEKKIQDYLHLYLGCQCVFEDSLYSLSGIIIDRPLEEKSEGPVVLYDEHLGYDNAEFSEVKPILRPLSDMTEEEAAVLTKFNKIDTVIECPYFNNIHKLKHGEQLRYLLARHFDLFCLIEAGLAIDKTKLTTHA